MTIISSRVFHPLPGKADIALERAKRYGAVLTQSGAVARVARIAWGDGAGDLVVYGSFASVTAGAKTFVEVQANPDARKLIEENEANPSALMEGPEVWRTVFGEAQPGYPVLLQREYQIDRKNLKRALELLPEIQALHPAPLIGAVPIFSRDMARLLVVYTGKSLIDIAERVDGVGLSPAFQSIVERAAEFAHLAKARVLANV